MAEEIRKEESKQAKKLERLLQPPKVYSKTTATPEQIEKAKAEYIKNVTEAYNKFNNKKISEQKYKELIKTYKNDFDMETKGRRYLRMIKLHAKGKTLKSIKLFDFGYFALNKEKTQKMTALLKDNEILKKKAKATRNNAIYLSDQIGIDKQKNNLLEIKLQLKYDINQYKTEDNAAGKIRQAKVVSKQKIIDIKQNIAQQKQRNKDFYKMIKEKRASLIFDAKKQYDETNTRYKDELKQARKIKTNSLEDRIDKKQQIRHIKCIQK